MAGCIHNLWHVLPCDVCTGSLRSFEKEPKQVVMKKNKRREEWEDAINLMTKEEKGYILAHPVGYYKSFLNMVWSETADDPLSVYNTKVMINTIIHIIEGLGSRCRVNDENEICFYFQGADFAISFDDTTDYIIIVDNSWKVVKVNDFNILQKMIRVINRVNVGQSATMAYIIDEEEQVMDIFSHTNIPYYPNYTYLEKYLHNKLVDMVNAHELVAYYLQKEEDYSLEESISLSNPDVTN